MTFRLGASECERMSGRNSQVDENERLADKKYQVMNGMVLNKLEIGKTSSEGRKPEKETKLPSFSELIGVFKDAIPNPKKSKVVKDRARRIRFKHLVSRLERILPLYAVRGKSKHVSRITVEAILLTAKHHIEDLQNKRDFLIQNVKDTNQIKMDMGKRE